MLHRSCFTEEPGKLKRNICEREECKEKHLSPLMCCLYFRLILWLSFSHPSQHWPLWLLTQRALSHSPFEMDVFCTLCMMRGEVWQTSVTFLLPVLANMSLVFLCVHEVPACRGFQSSQGWRTVLSSWMSVPRSSLSRMNSWSDLPKVSLRCRSFCELCACWKGKWGV